MTDLFNAYNDAIRAKRAVEDARDDARSAALAEVNARFRDQLVAADAAIAAAKLAHENAKIANQTSNPVVGKIVSKSVQVKDGRWRWKTVDIKGIVEVTTSETIFPANKLAWKIPSGGDLFVRLLKNDGTPGVRIDNYNNQWKLVE